MSTTTHQSGGRPSGTIPDRIFDRIRHDFPADDDTALVVRLLEPLVQPDPAGTDRILAAILILAEGRLSELQDAIDLYHTDWRDLLCAAELADDDWPERADGFLGEH